MNPSTPSADPENELENSATYPAHPLTDSIVRAENQLQKLEESKSLPINFVIWLSTACSLLRSRLIITQVSGQSQGGLKEFKSRLEAIYEDPTFTKIRESQEPLSPGIEQDYKFIIGFFEGIDNNQT